MTIALFIGRSAEDNREFAELQSKEQLSMKQSPGDSSVSKALDKGKGARFQLTCQRQV